MGAVAGRGGAGVAGAGAEGANYFHAERGTGDRGFDEAGVNRRRFIQKGLEILSWMGYSFGNPWESMAIPIFDDATVSFDSALFTFDGGALLGEDTDIGRIDPDLLRDSEGRPAQSALLYLVPGGTGVPIYSFRGDAWTGQQGLYFCTLDKVPMHSGAGSVSINKPLRVDGYRNLEQFRWALEAKTGHQQLIVQISYSPPSLGEGSGRLLRFYGDELIACAPSQVIRLSESVLENENGHPAQMAMLAVTGAGYPFFSYSFVRDLTTNTTVFNTMPYRRPLIVRGIDNIRRWRGKANVVAQQLFVAYAV